jgi:HSP20 family protein
MKLARYQHPLFSSSPAWARTINSPLAAFSNLGRLMDLDSFFGNPTPAALASDVFEDETAFHARFELPGVEKDAVKIELADGRLKVDAHRLVKHSEGESRIEMSRSLSLPDGIDENNIQARLENGLLTLTLTKSEERKPRTIELS